MYFVFGESLEMGIKILLSLRVGLWLMYKYIYLGKVISNKFWSFI